MMIRESSNNVRLFAAAGCWQWNLPDELASEFTCVRETSSGLNPGKRVILFGISIHKSPYL